MSIFARIDQIERQMTSLENALDTRMSSKSASGKLTSAQDAASFQSMINSMTNGQRFDPVGGFDSLLDAVGQLLART